MVEALCKYSQFHPTISSGAVTGGKVVLGFLKPDSFTLFLCRIFVLNQNLTWLPMYKIQMPAHPSWPPWESRAQLSTVYT